MLGPIIADIDGFEMSAEDREFLEHPLIGGLILFSRNYAEPAQLQALMASVKSLKRQDPLLVSVDHEGGRVQRFRSGFTALPPMAALGGLYNQNPEKALRAAFLTGWFLAAELRLYDIDYSYTPVLDLDYKISAIIGNRAFHADPVVVIALTKALIDGLHEAGMAVMGKHFPGHGAVEADSHVATPIDERDMAALWQADIQPYSSLIQQGYLDSIMTAHVIYPQIDPEPPCFSPFWLQRILRDELQFKGLIVSDDLTMEGATGAGGYADRAELALQAGCDMLLICNNRVGATQALEHLSGFYTFDSQMHERCQRMYAEPIVDYFNEHSNWKEALNIIQELNEIELS